MQKYFLITALLRPHQVVRNLCPLLRRVIQRHPQEISEHGRQGLRLPLDKKCAPRKNMLKFYKWNFVCEPRVEKCHIRKEEWRLRNKGLKK